MIKRMINNYMTYDLTMFGCAVALGFTMQEIGAVAALISGLISLWLRFSKQKADQKRQELLLKKELELKEAEIEKKELENEIMRIQLNQQLEQ